METEVEPPLTRQQLLRPVILVCGTCLRNLGYYQAGWEDKKPVFRGELQVTINSNFIDMAVLEWCKLFGEEKHELHHWQWIIDNIDKRRAFKGGLLQTLACEKRDWSALRNRAIKYRNVFLAHLGSNRKMELPHLELIRRSVIYYATYLFEHENDRRTYGTLHGDPEAYYQHHLREGLQFYGRQLHRSASPFAAEE
jgi:hypothetical protein